MKKQRQAKMTFATMIIVIFTVLFSCKKAPVAPGGSNLFSTANRAVYPSPLAGNVLSWFNQMQLPNGLLQSAEHSNFVSLYDNSLAALVFISQGEYAKAEAVFDFFNLRINSEFLVGPGGFYQVRDSSGAPLASNRWLGDNAWLLIALNNYAARVNPTKYQNLSSVITTWIRGLQDAGGGVRGGTTAIGNTIGYVTEGIIDAFDAVMGYDNFHKNILHYLQANRWDANKKLLIAWPGNKYLYALDNNSWGYCAFEGFPISVLQKADIYKNTQTATVNGAQITGFAPDIDKDVVWPEGTGQMIVAFQKAGQTDQANFYFDEMGKLAIPSPGYPSAVGFPYASNPGTGYGADPLWTGADINPCISSGAWFLFASSHFDPMALGYAKNIPTPDKFWLNETGQIVDGTIYTFISAVNNTSVIDVGGNVNNDETPLVLWGSNNGNNQKWLARYVGNGYYTFKSMLDTTKVMDARAAGTANGTRLQIYHSNNTNAQKWLVSYDGSYFRIKSSLIDKSIDVSGASSNNGTQIQLWDNNNTNAQKFRLVRQ